MQKCAKELTVIIRRGDRHFHADTWYLDSHSRFRITAPLLNQSSSLVSISEQTIKSILDLSHLMSNSKG